MSRRLSTGDSASALGESYPESDHPLADGITGGSIGDGGVVGDGGGVGGGSSSGGGGGDGGSGG